MLAHASVGHVLGNAELPVRRIGRGRTEQMTNITGWGMGWSQLGWLASQHPSQFPPPTFPTEMTSPNGLICFTNCLLRMEGGSLARKDLWIDERRGIVLDSQVREEWFIWFPV